MSEEELRRIVREELERVGLHEKLASAPMPNVHWSQSNGPFCSVCWCGGNWHYQGCEVGKERGDTHFVSASEKPAERPEWLSVT